MEFLTQSIELGSDGVELRTGGPCFQPAFSLQLSTCSAHIWGKGQGAVWKGLCCVLWPVPDPENIL